MIHMLAMRLRPVALRNARWDMVGVAIAVFLLGFATTHSSAIFIQRDTIHQDFVALGLARGCWEFITEKMLAVLLLWPLFWIFGPSPHIEMWLLAFSAAISAALVYEMARLSSNSRLSGLLASLILVALPAFQFYSRTYLGFIAPCLLGAWYSIWRKRWWWAGFCLGLSILAHFNSLVPAGISAIVVFVFHVRQSKWQHWVFFALGGLTPIAVIEGLFFFYAGPELFQWTQGTFAMIFRFSGIQQVASAPNWFWMAETIVGANGLFAALILALGATAPLIIRGNRTGTATSIAFLGVAAFYFVQGGIGRSLMAPRSLASSYPFWAIGSGIVLSRLATAIPITTFRKIIMGAIATLLFATAVSVGSFMYEFTKTPYPDIEALIVKIAGESRPLRYYYGNPWTYLFYGQIHGVEMLVNDDRWVEQGRPGQAVLIFDGAAPSQISREKYTITTVRINDSLDSTYPPLTAEASIPRQLEVWWPSQHSEPIKPATPPASAVAAFYYRGTGCFTAPKHSDGDRPRALHYYQLWIKRLQALFQK